jgi:hypothetical protein
MEALWGEATVAPSFRSVVEHEQLGRRVSAWDDECGGGIDRRTAHRWVEFGRCGTTPQCRRNRAQDGDLAGVHQLVDRLRYEEGGGHGMAVADSDEERWARTDANGCSGGAAPGSLGQTAAQGGSVAPEEGIRGRGCGGGWVSGRSVGPHGGRERGGAPAGNCRRRGTGTGPRAAGAGRCAARRG